MLQRRTIASCIGKIFLLAERVSGWPSLTAIRSALIVTLPLMFLGSLGELVNSFPLDAYRAFMLQQFGPGWREFGNILKDATFAVMSLIMVCSIGYHLAEQYDRTHSVTQANPAITALVAFSSFFCLLQPDGDILSRRWLGVAGLFVAILVSVVATRLFLALFSCKRLHLHLPGGTPDVAIPEAFTAFLPGILTVAAFAFLGLFMRAAVGISLHETVYELIRMPFDAIGDGLGRGMLYILSLHTLWFAGIHGSNVLDPITHDIYGAAMLANQTAAAAGLPLPHIMTKTFMDTFVFMGGAGTGISLAGALILFGKAQGSRKIGLISLVPALFNINEVLLFGLPIVLNPLLLIPFLATPLVLAAISYVVVAAGLVPGTGTMTEWTTPVLLNGYLATGSLKGSFLQLANLVMGILLYAPFVLLGNRVRMKQISAAFHELLLRSCTAADSSGHRLGRNDDAGALARTLIRDLEYDLREGRGLFLEFQPQVCARTGRVVGAEALIRWRHPFYGLIPAPITVALAEESGLVRPMGLWVFETACRVRRDWLDADVRDLSIAVNVSALQLKRSLPDQFLNVVHRYDLPPWMMEVEVTESGALDSDTPESHVLARLYDEGFPVAIDDFGMGHSSLKYLKQFPVSVVKIDGAISRDVCTNPICEDIVASITRLCRARNMLSVAEFVETEEQAGLLRDLGCDVFQGYLYSRPLSAEDCLRFILDRNERKGGQGGD